MGVVLQNCLADFCTGSTTTFEGWAVVRLVNPSGGPSLNTVTGKYIPVTNSKLAQINPATGCWTACEIACNDIIAPSGTYYEIEEWVNGECQGPPHIVQLDCANTVYPNPTPLSSVSLTTPDPGAGSLLTGLIHSNQSPWNGTDGNGIAITAGDSATGLAGNGHEPSIALRLSSDVGNLASFGADTGLFVSAPALNVADGDTVDLALTGTGTTADPYVITAEAIVDPSASNALASSAAGLFVSAMNVIVTDGDTVDLAIDGDGTPADPFNITADVTLDPSADNTLTAGAAGLLAPSVNLGVVDTSTVDLALTGDGTTAAPWSITGDLTLSPLADNAATATTLGLYVQDKSNLSVTQAPGITLGLSGDGSIAAPWDISAAPMLSGAAGNAAQVFADGIYAPTHDLSVAGSSTVDTNLTGAGTTASPWVISADVMIDPRVDNILIGGAAGVYVLQPDANVDGTTVGGTGQGAAPLSVIVSPSAGNAIATTPLGLYVPEADVALGATDSATVDLTLTGAGTTASPWSITADVIVDPAVNNFITTSAAGVFATVELDVTDSATVDLTITGNGSTAAPWAIAADVIVDPAVNNLITSNAAGIFATVELDVTDSATVDLTITGNGSTAAPWAIAADVAIDPAVNNLITSNAAGIFATVELIASDSDTVDLTVTGDGTVATPWTMSADVIVDPASLGQVSVSGAGLRIDQTVVASDDTDTVDTDISGSGTNADPYVVASNVVIDPAIDNFLTSSAAGLHVGIVTDLGYNPATGDLTFTAPDGTVTTHGLGISTVLTSTAWDAVTNELTLTFSDGSTQTLDFTDLQDTHVLGVTDSPSIDLTLTGNGSTATPWDIAANVIIDPAIDNAITDGAAGLFAQEITGDNGIQVIGGVVSTDFSHSDGITGAGSAADPLALVLDPAANNALSLSPAGLHALDQVIVSADANNLIIEGTDDGAYLDTATIRAEVDARWDATAPAAIDGALLTKNASGEILLPVPVLNTWLLGLGVIGHLDVVNQGIAQRYPVEANATLSMRTPTLGEAADADVVAHIVDQNGIVLSVATIVAGAITGAWSVPTLTIGATTLVSELLISAGTAAAPGGGLVLPVLVTEA